MLLDLLSDPAGLNGVPDPSLNAYLRSQERQSALRWNSDRQRGVEHEAGHFLGSFHVDQFNTVLNLMDQGGNFPLLYGVGPDGVGGAPRRRPRRRLRQRHVQPVRRLRRVRGHRSGQHEVGTFAGTELSRSREPASTPNVGSTEPTPETLQRTALRWRLGFNTSRTGSAVAVAGVARLEPRCLALGRCRTVQLLAVPPVLRRRPTPARGTRRRRVLEAQYARSLAAEPDHLGPSGIRRLFSPPAGDLAGERRTRREGRNSCSERSREQELLLHPLLPVRDDTP